MMASNHEPLISDATVEWIEALIERGWAVRYVRQIKRFAWRSPEGISGDEYQSDSLETFPRAVCERIRKDFPRAAV
ncbi:hypothetical protein LCGC14_1538040 [marine sediment metagenome]|uniref:Uncharacterized protein n=1 Tax=marine sediment metagenome TaxID=412755 RepID=A0A0F9LUR5_9ZZZZ